MAKSSSGLVFLGRVTQGLGDKLEPPGVTSEITPPSPWPDPGDVGHGETGLMGIASSSSQSNWGTHTHNKGKGIYRSVKVGRHRDN